MAGERPGDEGIGVNSPIGPSNGHVSIAVDGGVSGGERRGRVTEAEEGSTADVGRGWKE